MSSYTAPLKDMKFVLNELDKRRLAAVLVELYQLKGTEKGIRNAVRLFMGIELASIPTYILVSMSRPLPAAQ